MKKSTLLLFCFFLSFSVFAQNIVYQANFETTYDPLNFTSNGTNVWQVGTPMKPFFGTAMSAPNGIMTDTMNPYPVSNRSSFEIRNIDPSFLFVHNVTQLTFDHKYQTTAGHDGGAIEVSYDGINWQNFLVDTFYQNHSETGWGQPFSINVYSNTDTLYTGENGFSGTSSGWITSTILWEWFLPVSQNRSGWSSIPDSMFIRFTFYSDSIAESKDGWIIDNISIIGSDPSGIDELSARNGFIISPNPAHENFKITLDKMAFVDKSLLSIYNIFGEKIYQKMIKSEEENISGLFMPGIYFVSINNGKKIISQKIIIE
jgi:hypothetical protein